MSIPQGWKQNPDDLVVYGAEFRDTGTGQGGKIAVDVNLETGARSVYKIAPITGIRTKIYDFNPSSNKPVWNNDYLKSIGIDKNKIKDLKSSGENPSLLKTLEDRLKTIETNLPKIDKRAMEVAIKDIATVGQRKKLLELDAYKYLNQNAPAPAEEDSQTDEEDGSSRSGIVTTGTVTPSSRFRNVSTFNSTDTYGNWKYPEVIDIEQDYMMISTFNYQVADVFSNFPNANVADIDSVGGRIFGGESISKRTLKEPLGSVILPVPSSVVEANATGWGSDKLSNLTAGLLGGAAKVVDDISDGNLIGGLQNIKETAQEVLSSSGGASGQIKQQLTLNAAAAVVKKLGIAANAEAYRARVTGTVINPNLELLFNGPGLRAFQFSIKMMPTSIGEAKQIRGIIKFFKKAMAPKRARVQEDSFFLGAPNLFQIKFKNKNGKNKYLPDIKSCALINFNVNYTAEGFYAAFLDGQPLSVQLDFSFGELTPIYNDNYGSVDGNSVGFYTDNIDDLENTLYTPSIVERAQRQSDEAQETQADRERISRVEQGVQQTTNPSGLAGGIGDPTATAADILRDAGGLGAAALGEPGTQIVFPGGLKGG